MEYSVHPNPGVKNCARIQGPSDDKVLKHHLLHARTPLDWTTTSHTQGLLGHRALGEKCIKAIQEVSSFVHSLIQIRSSGVSLYFLVAHFIRLSQQ